MDRDLAQGQDDTDGLVGGADLPPRVNEQRSVQGLAKFLGAPSPAASTMASGMANIGQQGDKVAAPAVAHAIVDVSAAARAASDTAAAAIGAAATSSGAAAQSVVFQKNRDPR